MLRKHILLDDMKHPETFNLLPEDDLADKLRRLRALMAPAGLDAILIADNANKYYLTGRVFSGFILLTAEKATWFLRRPTCFEGPDIVAIRKVENIADHIYTSALGKVGLELSSCSYADVLRYAKALGVGEFGDADALLMQVRSVKTPYELDMIARSSSALTSVYRKIPEMYRPGMSDVELQIEIERDSRLKGCLGIFRINGREMELNMGSVLVGDNADTPSPYDFAMGGAGFDPSLPVGADGTIIRPGHTVMVDTNGDFTGYMTDMTRTFACGDVGDKARHAHQVSIDICRCLEKMGCPGVAASDLYNAALEIAERAGLADRFMGHRSQAGFVGHGVGIAINEWPVIAPRSRQILEAGNVIALEPKFVIEGAGAVGIENTYVVTPDGLRRLTEAPEDMITLLDNM